MAIECPDHVQETTQTEGTGTVTLDGAATGFLTFGSQVSNGESVYYAIWDDSGNVETGQGTYLTGPARIQRSSVRFSTNGGAKVDWGAGTRNVASALPGRVVRTLLDPSAPTGLVTRTLVDEYTARTIQGGTYVAVTNGDGVSGDPTLDDSGIAAAFLALTGGTLTGDLVVNKASAVLRALASSGFALVQAEAGSLASTTYRRLRLAADPAQAGVLLLQKVRPSDGDVVSFTLTDMVGGELWHDGNTDSAVVTAKLAGSAVSRPKLKTATATFSGSLAGSPDSVLVSLHEYSFFPQIESEGEARLQPHSNVGTASPDAADPKVEVETAPSGAGGALAMAWRYIQA